MRLAGLRRRVRQALPLGLLASASACAYFNGIYNAREAQRNADKRLQRGRDADAATFYATMATKAETVLARFPKSRWRGEALFLAGRGHALSGQCGDAIPRLDEFLRLGGQPADRRQLATLALATCYVRTDRYSDGRALLEPLVTAKDRRVAEQASLWAARAAIALGDNDGAQRYLGLVNAAAAQWELAAASLGRGEYARADSLLTVRAAQGDWRQDLEDQLGELWAAGERDAVERLVARYDAARTPSYGKARLHLLAARLQMAASEAHLDSLAQAHLLAAMRVSTDTATDREAAVRLARLRLRAVRSVGDVDDIVRRARDEAKGNPEELRLEDNVMLVRILERGTDPTGAALFLAAEVARDSLQAPYVARELLYRLASTRPGSLFAPRALLAASNLWPDSADAFYQRIRTQYAQSPYSILLQGGDPSYVPAYGQAERLLRDAWQTALMALGDSINRLRPAPSQAQATSGSRGTPP